MILKIKHFRNVKIRKKEVNGINNLNNKRTAQSMFELMNHPNANYNWKIFTPKLVKCHQQS